MALSYISRMMILAMMLSLIPLLVYAQTPPTEAPPADSKFWEVLFKVAFPVVMTIIGPIVTGFIKTAPDWVKYLVASLSSMVVGAGIGEIPAFPLTPESAATVGLLSGPVGQALFLAKPQPPRSNGSASPSAFWLPLILVGGLLTMTACTSVMPLGDGRFAVPETVEVRSPFGTNAGYVRLQNCQRVPTQEPGFSQYDYVNCHTMHGWTPTQSQGQGGQVAIGLGLGLGGGLGAAFSGNSSSSAASSSSSVVPAAPVGGGHGGHH